MANRLHCLGWLRVIAIPGVFLCHANRPFDLADWHIRNTELSLPLSAFLLLFAPWGMPLFFLVPGAGKEFASRHRTLRQYVNERFKRLLAPYLFGCLLLSPILLNLEWTQSIQTQLLGNSCQEFVSNRPLPIRSEIFGWAEYHLWSLGFLFSFSPEKTLKEKKK
jgi:fucose 4-O-acetylase-like acetyltransferase